MISFHIVVAVDARNGIGKEGKLPWHLPADLKHFKEITCATASMVKKNAVIMGRKTWESLPEKFRPLPNRLNIVLSRNSDLRLPEGVEKADSLKTVAEILNRNPFKDNIEIAFIIGGGEIFKTALRNCLVQKIYLTRILQDFHCDTFFPAFDDFRMAACSSHYTENAVTYCFAEYVTSSRFTSGPSVTP
ncbi:MAG: hypothetical protein A2Y04_06165 [Omnitrophica WOR_2 bacterium GWC2_45_7]|nr:MAG: hypothetical protein A2Z81_07130 [Omnitrophica WOR_2 bacterium GWA2_45_18]OGX20010.1 MAG: hypothetical protein A2Y04_06165 [Omnitrophica WOR_2 bacterium GWC2_45_7]